MKVNRNHLIFYLVIAIALLARLAYFFQYAGTPFYAVPMWDAGEYHDMAVALSQGHLHPSFAFRPILYPILLGFVYMIFGIGPLVPSLLQLAGGVYACVLVQRIASRLFGEWAGFGAGIVAALSGMMVFYDLELMPTSLEVLLMLLLLNELIGFADNKEWASGQVARAGVWFALAILTRPVMLPLVIPVSVYMLSIGINKEKKALFILIPLTALLFNGLFNLGAGNGVLLTPAQGGVNFYIGNRPGADGFTATLPNVGSGWGWDTITKLAEKEVGTRLTIKQVDGFYWLKGFEEITADPAGWLKLQWRKGILFWSHLEISNDRDLYYHAHRYPVIGWLMFIGFPLALPLALLGLWVHYQDKRVFLLTGVIVFYAAVVALFFVNGRFRHPLTPILFILASGGVTWLIDSIKRKSLNWNARTIGGTLAIIIGIAAPFAANSGIDPKRWDYGYFTEATALDRMGDAKGAEELYNKALKANPRAPFVNYNLGELKRKSGEYSAAAAFYSREVEIQPAYGKAWNNLGLMMRATGNNDSALECFERAFKVRPDLIEAAQNAANAWRQLGEEAQEAGDTTVARHSFDRSSYYIGRINRVGQ